MNRWVLRIRDGAYVWVHVPRALDASAELGPFTTRKQALKFAPMTGWDDETGDGVERLA